MFDVAILRLEVPVNLGHFALARPLCMPNPFRMAEDEEEDEHAIVAGWGKTEYGG